MPILERFDEGNQFKIGDSHLRKPSIVPAAICDPIGPYAIQLGHALME
jgi:hypothetical protein